MVAMGKKMMKSVSPAERLLDFRYEQCVIGNIEIVRKGN